MNHFSSLISSNPWANLHLSKTVKVKKLNLPLRSNLVVNRHLFRTVKSRNVNLLLNLKEKQVHEAVMVPLAINNQSVLRHPLQQTKLPILIHLILSPKKYLPMMHLLNLVTKTPLMQILSKTLEKPKTNKLKYRSHMTPKLKH
uniref:Uncharacterized protein n=1 Tax=Cacopsylla melanoneura TaxID=428564 RepID=A0A8D8LIS6_9HEMI